MKKFHNKKLLVLGSNAGSTDIVRYARDNGAYTIVADYLEPAKSPAKLIADENVLISTAATEELDKLIKQKHIDGVLAGISEFNLLQAMSLSKLNGLRFYCNKEQWDTIENKENFRKLCLQHHIPCPQTYYMGDGNDIKEEFPFPLIVKPVDSSSSIGITICKDQTNFQQAIREAKESSSVHRIIIEDYFDGNEFSAHYSIANGKARLVCIDNRYPAAVNEGMVTTIPIARVYPSSIIDEYIEQVDTNMKHLCESLHLESGVLFIQGLYNRQKNKFCVFEAGLRCAGEVPYRFIEKINGVNFMHNLIDYTLLGKSEDYDIMKEDPYMKGKICGTVSFATKGGVVGKILHLEESVKAIPDVIEYECRYKEGAETPSGNTLRQLMLRFVIVSENKDVFKKNIHYLNHHIQVMDNQGQEMCIRFDENLLY